MMTIYLMPASFQELRDLVTRIRADFVANIVKEGQFTTLDNGITFHYRERCRRRAARHLHAGPARARPRPSSTSRSAGQTIETERPGLSRSREGQRAPPGAEQPRFVDRRLRALRGRPRGLQPGGRRRRLQAARAQRRRSSCSRTRARLLPDPGGPVPGRAARPAVRLALPLRDDADRLRGARRRADHPPGARHRRSRPPSSRVVALRIAGFAASSAAVRSPAASLRVYGAPSRAIGIVARC